MYGENIFLLLPISMMESNEYDNYIVKVAKHLTDQTKIVPLYNEIDMKYGGYGLTYPFMDSDDIYYASTLEHGNAVIRQDLKWYVKEFYGIAEHELYDLIDLYKEMVLEKIKNL